MELQENSNKRLFISLIVGLLGLVCSIAADFGIRKFFPQRIILKDFMFLIVPHIPLLSYLADGTITLATLYFLFKVAKLEKARISQLLFAYGILFSIRALLNFVTPIGDPSGDYSTYGFLELKPMLGMFPSGHIGVLNVEFWLARYWGYSKKIQRIFILAIVVEAIALWATRGHYSIDIAGGIALGYFAAKLAHRHAV